MNVERPVITTVDVDTGFHVIVDSIVGGMVRYEVSMVDEAIKQGLRRHGWIPATTDEIMDAHPKCGTCKHSWHRRPDQLICDNNDGHWDGEYKKIDPDKSYCMYWEAKT